MDAPPLPRFATTKIQPPRQGAARVERPALDAALRAALLAHRAVLLQAPAGFGKTATLAAQIALQAPREALAWVALDEDDDAERLFACLAAALERFDLPWRAAPEALVQLAGGDAPSLRRAATELVNALAAADVPHGLLVLDDLHRVKSSGAFALLDALLAQLPPRWTLLLAGRTAPPLALARLRASGELAEFTQDDLRFTPDEAGRLLEGLPQAAGRASELFERTAGWPAGLRLAHAALRTRAAAQGGMAAGGRQLIDRHLFDYLAAEVLDDLPPALHDFLLRSAVLPELTAARAAGVSGDRRAPEWLDEIERRGLFATMLDADERTLVLHDLFRDALLQRLHERLPDEVPTLLRRAAAGEGDALRRVGYLLRAGEWAAADAALAEAAAELFIQGNAGEVLRLVEQFPPEHRSATLLRLAGTACTLRWRWTEMATWLQQAATVAQANGDAHELVLAQARLAYALYPLDRNDEAVALIAELRARPLAPDARVLMLMADGMQHFRQGLHTQLPALYEEVLALLAAGQPLMRWWECAPPVNWATIAGMAPLLERWRQGAAARLADRPLPMRADLHVLHAALRLWAGDLAAAHDALAQADEDIRWFAVAGEAAVSAQLLRLILDAVHGRHEAVRAGMAARLALEDDAPTERRLLWRHQMAVHGVRVSDTLGDVDGLRHWAGLLRENPLQDPGPLNPRAIAARARYAAAQGRWADALGHFEQLLPRLPTIDVNGQRTDLTLRHAHVLLRLQRLPEAAAVAAPVLDRLIVEGVRGQALLSGPALLRTLAEARWGTLLSPTQQAELQAVAQLSAAAQGVPAAAAPAAPDAPADDLLSQREREVLERIAAGDSNKLIARALDISPHTVKRHVANILDKLGLASRGQASAWLHEHG